MTLEQFNPDIRIVAIDANDVAVTFDSAAAHDDARAPKVVRISRDFTALTVKVEGFLDAPDSSLGDRKEFLGSIKLVVSADKGDTEHMLAEPDLWIGAESRNRKGNVPFNFPSASAVQRAVRHGVAAALTRALAAYYAKEGQMDSIGRMPAPSLVPAEGRVMLPSAPVPAATHAGVFDAFTASAANDGSPESKSRFRKRLVMLAVATPLAVYGLLWLGGTVSKKPDPIQDAVAKAMVQSPAAAQAQVDLTKETLKQMGLDPGKSGDVGCLAQQ